MDEVHKKSLKEVLPKKEFGYGGVKTNSKRNQQIDMIKETDNLQNPKTKNYYKPTKKYSHQKFYFIGLCIFFILIIFGYKISAIFSSVIVQITPKQLAIPITGSFEASRAPAEDLEFSVIKLEETSTQLVPSNGLSKVETKATGVVTIENDYSPAPQTLIIGTRLETPDGLIFKLDNTIVVPGRIKEIPGKISVKITASEVGSKYNVGTTNFKIVGFKNTPRYDKFYVQTKTLIGGGKQGLINIVKEEDRAKAVASMQADLKAKAIKKAQLQIPKDFIIFDDGMMFSFSDEIISGTTSSSAIISTKISLVALLFNVNNLSKYFAEEQLKTESKESIEGIKISNIKTLIFKLDDKEKFDFEKTNKINFTLNGTANLVWLVDIVDLKNKLLHTSIKNSDKIFANYPAIYRAEAHIRPTWVLSFPNNRDKINFNFIINI